MFKVVNDKLQALFTLLRLNAEEMLDEIAATMADIEEEREFVREGVDLISNICSIDEENARRLIKADTAAKAATARKPKTPEANKICSEILNFRSAADSSAVGFDEEEAPISLLDVVMQWVDTQRSNNSGKGA